MLFVQTSQPERPEISALLFKSDDKKAWFYTGLPKYNVLKPVINLWSQYYSLIIVAQNGSFVFISQARGSHVSDKEITQEC